MNLYYYYCDYRNNKAKPDASEATLQWRCDNDIRAVNGGFDEYECKWMVEELADDFYHNHDGWDYTSWSTGNEPMVFFIFNANKEFLFSTEINIETQPVFNSEKIKVDYEKNI